MNKPIVVMVNGVVEFFYYPPMYNPRHLPAVIEPYDSWDCGLAYCAIKAFFDLPMGDES
jgi:hypothetical protein